jgi:hypothetical protein
MGRRKERRQKVRKAEGEKGRRSEGTLKEKMEEGGCVKRMGWRK